MRFAPLLLLIIFVVPAEAAVSCDVSEISAYPGEVVSFDLTVTNDLGWEATIDLDYYAPGFDGEFVYNGKVVKSLHFDAGERKSVEFRLKIPEDAREGTYFVTVYAFGSYTLTIHVERSCLLEIRPYVSRIVAEAGDTVKFQISVANEKPGMCEVGLACSAPNGWSCRFFYGNSEVRSLVMGGNDVRTIELEVETDSSAAVGSYTVTAKLNEEELKLGIDISKSHAGERGEVKLKVVDRDGRGVDEAEVRVGNEIFYTSPEGEVVFEIDPGVYDIRISKGGYFEKVIEDVEVKAGKKLDLGTVYLEKRAYYVEIDVANPKVTSVLGSKASFSVVIENVGYARDTYSLSVEGLPEGFYAVFIDTNGNRVSEITVDGGESKELTVEILQPPSAEPGEYSFRFIAAGKARASVNLTLNLIGEYRLRFELEGGMYSFGIEAGEKKTLKAYVINAGRGTTLTNVSIEASAPQGWKVSVSPSSVPALEPYKSEVLTLTVFVPPDAVPSSYKLEFTVKSDQVQVREDIRVDVEKKSYAPLIGAAIVIGAIAAVIVIFRKFGRR